MRRTVCYLYLWKNDASCACNNLICLVGGGRKSCPKYLCSPQRAIDGGTPSDHRAWLQYLPAVCVVFLACQEVISWAHYKSTLGLE